MSIQTQTAKTGGGANSSATGAVLRPKRRRKPLTFDKASFMAVFLGIPLVIYLGLVIYPYIQAFHLSLTNWRGFSSLDEASYVGLDNYIYLFKSERFMLALTHNVTLAIFLPLTTIILALTLAIVITMGGHSHGNIRGIKGAGFYRVVSFFPYVIPGIIIGFMWQLIFSPDMGLVNPILTSIGFTDLANFAWLGDERTAFGVSLGVMVWGLVGFYMLLFIAAIKSIPAEIYEAARIDGAGRFTTAIRLTIPLIRDNIQTAYVYMGIIAMDAFIYMTALNPTGGPNYSTLVMSQELYQTAFGGNNMWGRGAAMGVVLSFVALSFAGLVFLVNRLTGGKDSVSY